MRQIPKKDLSAKSAGETAELIGVNRKTGQPAPRLFRDQE